MLKAASNAYEVLLGYQTVALKYTSSNYKITAFLLKFS